MDSTLAKDLYASQMAAFGVSLGILRALVVKQLLSPSEAAAIIRDAAENLPDVADEAWKAVQHQTYKTAAERLEYYVEDRAAALIAGCAS